MYFLKVFSEDIFFLNIKINKINLKILITKWMVSSLYYYYNSRVRVSQTCMRYANLPQINLLISNCGNKI